MEATLTADGSYFLLRFAYSPTAVNIARAIPGYRKFSADKKAWRIKPTRSAIEYVLTHFKITNDDPVVVARLQDIKQKNELANQSADLNINDFKFKTHPFAHQLKAFALSRDRYTFAFFMEQGTGKSKVIIDTAAYLYTQGRIDALLVVAPNSVKTNWVTDELPAHMPDYVPYKAAYWTSTPNKAEKAALEALWTAGSLRVLCMNVEAFSSEKGLGKKYAQKFLDLNTVMMVIDESSRVKTPGAKRTQVICTLGQRAPYRRILTGTPVTQGPLDLYAQFKFLDEDILGHSSFYAFRNRYAIMGGYEEKQIIGYQNVEELQHLIAGYSFRVLKRDCLDLPEKIYQRREVELSVEQKRVYKELRDNLEAELGGEARLTVGHVLTKLLRLQQVLGGFVPFNDDATASPLRGANPRLEELMQVLAETSGKAIIWARFKAEIKAIRQAIANEYGTGSVVMFYGEIKTEDRTAARQAFQNPDSPVRFFIGQQSSGGIGLTLTQAQTVIYYSNTFSLEERLQSEDRAHRIGQKDNVTYIDLCARNTVDTRIVKALRDKKELSDLITQDDVRKWL